MLHKCPECGMDMQQYNFIVRCNKCMEFYIEAKGKHTGQPGLYRLKTEFIDTKKKEEPKNETPAPEVTPSKTIKEDESPPLKTDEDLI